MFLDHFVSHPSILLHTFFHQIKFLYLEHVVSHSLHYLYIQGECLYLQILSKHNEGYYPIYKEFPLYDYLQTEGKKEEGLK